MSPATFHFAILRCAAALVPAEQRTDWLAEWRSELWHIRRDSHGTNVGAFCMGAFRDAYWLRRNVPIGSGSLLQLDAPPTPEGIESFPDQGVAALSSPVRCLGWLATLGALCLVVGLLLPDVRSVLLSALYPRNLVLLTPRPIDDVFAANFSRPYPSVSRGQFESLKALDGGQFTDLAFYSLTKLDVETPRGNRTLYVAKTTASLFRILNIPIGQVHGGTPTLILTSDARRQYFNDDPRVTILPDLAWNLPGHVDGWLVADDSTLATLPATTEGLAVGSLRYGTLQNSRFHYIRIADRWLELCLGMLPVFVFSFLLWGMMLAGSAGTPGLRRSLFLLAKAVLLLPIVAFGPLDLTALSGSMTPLILNLTMLGIFLAARWTLVDQRDRCPVCLRLLAHPVRIGESSRILLEWHGTEFMCDRGHGLLYVPEWPAIWSDRQRWLRLGPSWGGIAKP